MDARDLRQLVKDCLSKHLLSSAVFFADKLLCLSDRAPEDELLLANVYFTDKQFGRALLLLRGSSSFATDYRFRYLSARCLVRICDLWLRVIQSLVLFRAI